MSICVSHLKFPLAEAEQQKYGKLLGKWQLIAAAKGDVETDQKVKRVFLKSVEYCGDLQEAIFDDSIYKGSSGKVYFVVAKDRNSNIQALGMATLYLRSLSLDWMVTHPHNIRSKLNERAEGRVEGAGSAILSHLETEIANLIPCCTEIRLQACQEAVPFYEKAGFTSREEGELRKMSKRVAAQFVA